jgi:hypothetical protein
VNDLYKENYKHRKKKLRKNTDNGKISRAHGLIESTVKMAILPKAIYILMQFPSKSQGLLSQRLKNLL